MASVVAFHGGWVKAGCLLDKMGQTFTPSYRRFSAALL